MQLTDVTVVFSQYNLCYFADTQSLQDDKHNCFGM
jgi:hypothetical protein